MQSKAVSPLPPHWPMKQSSSRIVPVSRSQEDHGYSCYFVIFEIGLRLSRVPFP